MRYEHRGELPAKRHVAHYRDGRLLTEEVMGYEGFSGNESILYHLQSPCKVNELGTFTPIERDEWVPDAYAHRLLRSRAGDRRRRPGVRSPAADVQRRCRDRDLPPGRRPAGYFYRNGEGDEVIFVHAGAGELETTFGTLSVP